MKKLIKNLIKNNLKLFTIIATIQLPITVLIMYVIAIVSSNTALSFNGWDGLGIYLLGMGFALILGLISLAIYIIILIEIKKNTNIKHIIIPLLPIIIFILIIVIGVINGFITDTKVKKAYTTDVFVNEVLTDFDNIDKIKSLSYEPIDNEIYILNVENYFEYDIDAYTRLEKNGIRSTQEQNEYIEILIPKVMEKIKDNKVYYWTPSGKTTKIKDWELVEDKSTRRYTIKITYTNFRTETYEIE